MVILMKGPYGTPSMARIKGLNESGRGSSCKGGGRSGSRGSRATKFLREVEKPAECGAVSKCGSNWCSCVMVSVSNTTRRCVVIIKF